MITSSPHLSHIGGLRPCEQEVAGIVLTVSGGLGGWLGRWGAIPKVGQRAANLGTTPTGIQANTICNYYRAKI